MNRHLSMMACLSFRSSPVMRSSREPIAPLPRSVRGAPGLLLSAAVASISRTRPLSMNTTRSAVASTISIRCSTRSVATPLALSCQDDGARCGRSWPASGPPRVHRAGSPSGRRTGRAPWRASAARRRSACRSADRDARASAGNSASTSASLSAPLAARQQADLQVFRHAQVCEQSPALRHVGDPLPRNLVRRERRQRPFRRAILRPIAPAPDP